MNKCYHCDCEINEHELTVTGNVIKKNNEHKRMTLYFCGWDCLTLFQLDDLVGSPYSKLDSAWKPVCKQLHDHIIHVYGNLSTR